MWTRSHGFFSRCRRCGACRAARWWRRASRSSSALGPAKRTPPAAAAGAGAGAPAIAASASSSATARRITASSGRTRLTALAHAHFGLRRGRPWRMRRRCDGAAATTAHAAAAMVATTRAAAATDGVDVQMLRKCFTQEPRRALRRSSSRERASTTRLLLDLESALTAPVATSELMLAPPPVQLTSPQPHHEALDESELLEGHQIIERLRGEQEALEAGGPLPRRPRRRARGCARRGAAAERRARRARPSPPTLAPPASGRAAAAHAAHVPRRARRHARLGAWRERAALLVVPPGSSGAPIDALERAALARERDELRGRIAVLENSLVHEKAARAAATRRSGCRRRRR